MSNSKDLGNRGNNQPESPQLVKEYKPSRAIDSLKTPVPRDMKGESQVRMSNQEDFCSLGSSIGKSFQQMPEYKSTQVLRIR
jgi:hypothetical protein